MRRTDDKFYDDYDLELPQDSPHVNTPIHVLDDDSNDIYFEPWKALEIPESENDHYYEVTSGTAGRIDLIADIKYADPELDWPIIVANNIIFVELEVTVGRILRIPDIAVVRSLYR